MGVVIKVEELGKQYRLGKVGSGSFGNDLNRWWHKVRGKEDPYMKIAEVNDRSVKGETDFVWALQGINFEVNQGDVLGIMGKNGAGKSTLLKILSRITGPTVGTYKVKGRIASLLEVGTGFHPDLSGRENIFLNGAILGMTRKEIRSKLDEIIDFSGIERYIDTPVKRYSSGMYVRLAFAVAAHLEPEILIVDEVLAVGDAEFQKKCLGKMQDVSVKDGRTVLFVSHNISAVRNLCSKGIVLVNGMLRFDGEVEQAITFYQSSGSGNEPGESGFVNYEPIDAPVQFTRIELVKQDLSNGIQFEYNDRLGLRIWIAIREKRPDYVTGFTIEDSSGNMVFVSTNDEYGHTFLEQKSPGKYELQAWFPAKLLKPGSYLVSVTVRGRIDVYHKVTNCFRFEITDTETYRGMKQLYRKVAIVAPEIEWKMTQHE